MLNKQTFSCRPPCSYNTHSFFTPKWIHKFSTCLRFPKYLFCSTRADISEVTFIYTWDTFLGHPMQKHFTCHSIQVVLSLKYWHIKVVSLQHDLHSKVQHLQCDLCLLVQCLNLLCICGVSLLLSFLILLPNSLLQKLMFCLQRS